ncbi:hypothetical protein [Burkholderia sp. MSMB1498]|uniref:hypothetical protein n=1 Tax=Burkholderia sp. MSMB1498 TaxID=1637842 RepID=UPI0012E39045|nr:hypothetical protein [Burkholderia sp. MSMB1498]
MRNARLERCIARSARARRAIRRRTAGELPAIDAATDAPLGIGPTMRRRIAHRKPRAVHRTARSTPRAARRHSPTAIRRPPAAGRQPPAASRQPRQHCREPPPSSMPRFRAAKRGFGAIRHGFGAIRRTNPANSAPARRISLRIARPLPRVERKEPDCIGGARIAPHCSTYQFNR